MSAWLGDDSGLCRESNGSGSLKDGMMRRTFGFLVMIGLTPLVMAAQGVPAGQPPQTPQPQQTPQTPPPASSNDALPDAPSAMVHEAPPAVPTGPIVVLDTSMGRMVCRLFDKEAPETAANFVALATGAKEFTDPVTDKKAKGVRFYDGTTFHRVIPGFMIQGGDRLGSGMGDAGYYLQDEIVPSLRFDVPGRMAMANSGPNTSSSQFFITEEAQPSLTGHYTIFGQCDEHSVVMVMSIARVQRNQDDKPLTPVTLNKVTVLREGQPLPPDPSVTPAAGTAAGAAQGAALGTPRDR